MNQFNLSNYNTPTKIYWILLALCSLGLIALSSIGFYLYLPLQFVVLVVTIFISAIISQHQPKIPRVKLSVSAKELIIFWGVIWLGVSGSVLLSLVGSLATYWLFPKDKKRWLATVFCSVIATFLAASTFYLFLENVAGFKNNFVGGNTIELVWLAAAFGILAVVHYAVYVLLYSVFTKLENDAPNLLKNIAGGVSANYGLAILGAIILHFAFLQFGLAFGLVILFIAVVGHLFFRLHLQSLELKTKEVGESSRIHLATVEALATAIDARDQVGIGHVRRTQIYAVGMGELLGLGDDEIQALTTGALLHDIGKLGVPDHILNKPGRLTPAEMEKMKIHSTIGAAILEKINFPYPVIPTVKYHHEMWDGSGYPEGLKREQIPLTARILAVADAYDTLRGARPYRAAVSRDDARKFLLNGSNTQFDPKLVDIFLRNLRQFEMEVDTEGLSYEFDNKVSDFVAGEDGTLSETNQQGYVEHIKRANREVFALYELARVFSASLNLQDTLSLFVKKVGELMPFETCAVYLLDKTQEFAEVSYAEGQNSDFLKGKRIKVGEGATGYVLKKRQAVYNINPALDFSFYQVDSIQDYTAMASLPLIANERLIGAVSLYSCELENYEDEHMRLLETVSRIASDAISKSVHHAETETHALTDPMTNLPNARCLQLRYENEAARASRNGSEFQLIMLDLDGFKAVNDTFGHKAGDMLLREISKVMRAQLREYDFLARYAGDEFVAIIPDTTSDGIQELCQRLEKAVLEFKLPVGDGRFAGVGVSVGSASFPKSGETLDQIIVVADKMMYSVKAQHKRRHDPAPIDNNRESSFHDLQTETIQLQDAEIQRIEIDETFIVELDESNIISSNALN